MERQFEGKERGERQIMPEDTELGKFTDGLLKLTAYDARIIQSKSKEDKVQVVFTCDDFDGYAIMHDFTLTGTMWALHNAMRTTGVLTEEEVPRGQAYSLNDEQILDKCRVMNGTALVKYDTKWNRTKMEYFVIEDEVADKNYPMSELMPEEVSEPIESGVFD